MRGYNAPMTNIRDYILDGTPEDVVARYESLPEIAEKSDFGVLDSNVVVVDTETTGFSFTHDELIQIAAAKLEGGAIVDWYVTFVNPGKPLPEEIVHLTGIHEEDVSGAPSPQDALAGLVDFAGDSIMVAHNVGFDKTFTTRHPEGYPLLENTWVDSLDLSRIALPRLKSHRLIDLVTYDKDAAEVLDKDLAHTAYGALVENTSGYSNTAVCDGYSYAYEFLLQKAGIRSAIVAGRAGETEETAGSHSWNLVELDDEWYEVDATWNDISVEEALDTEEEYSEIAEEAIRNKWYTDKLTHFLFNVTTEEISDFKPGKYFRYTNDRGWVSFLGDSVHIRYTADESESTGDYMSPLAPVAEGTQYAYEELKKELE